MTALPAVSQGEALNDAVWFARRPGRRYRLRPGPDGTAWIVRRTLFTPAFPYPDTDEALRPAWFLAAYPDLNPRERDELAKVARKAERATGRRTARAQHDCGQAAESANRGQGRRIMNPLAVFRTRGGRG
jgi:hypothetical protein